MLFYKDAFGVYLQRDDGGRGVGEGEGEGEGMGVVGVGVVVLGAWGRVRGWVRGWVKRGVGWLERSIGVVGWWRGKKIDGEGFVEVVTIEGVEGLSGYVEGPVVVERGDKMDGEDVNFLELRSEMSKEISLADDVEIRAFTGGG